MDVKRQFNPDAKYIDWPWSDGEFAAHVGDGLCARLEALEAEPAVRAVLVVTHVPLVAEQLFYKPNDQRWGVGNAFFGNLTLGRRVLAFGKVRSIISGHTHIGRSAVTARMQLPDLPPIPVTTLASDYDAPVYVIVDDAELGVPARS
jgi:hypothetical protein